MKTPAVILLALAALATSARAFHAQAGVRNGARVAQQSKRIGIDDFPIRQGQADDLSEASVVSLPSVSDVAAMDGGCPGWPEYKQWVDKLFDLAPPPPSCAMAESFMASLIETTEGSINLWVLRKRGNTSQMVNAGNPSLTPRGRAVIIQIMWEAAVTTRDIPDGVELLVYIADKPRNMSTLRPPGVSHPGDNSMPLFSFATEFPAGSGMPDAWKGHVPFPSHFFLDHPTVVEHLDEGNFLARRPVVFYRGRLSENCWGRFQDGEQECNTSVRSKLAVATHDPADSDVLDVGITGVAIRKKEHEIKVYFQRKHNLSFEAPTSSLGNSRMLLAAPGNGWAGATMMKAMVEGPAVLYLVDRSLDDEGFTHDLGEIYFPFMKPGTDYVPVDYGSIATEARSLNANPSKLVALYRARDSFAKKFLGIGCALTTIELLSNRYHDYMSSGCSPSDQ